MIKWIDRPGIELTVAAMLKDIMIRHRFEDCVDIPATAYHVTDYELTPRQLKVYKDMEQAKILVGGGSTPKITAVNASAVATKLIQISSGAVYDNDHKHHVIDTARYELVMDMAEARRHPLVYFFWQHQRDALVKEAESRGMKYCVLDGDATDSERDAMVARYQQKLYDVMFGHPKSVAHGQTLTAGTSIIWPCPHPDLEWWKQGNRRQARIGQTRKTEVIVVVAKNTIEERVYHEILMPKNKRMVHLLDLFT
jgi:SNF2 family DNA or RNA helicase